MRRLPRADRRWPDRHLRGRLPPGPRPRRNLRSRRLRRLGLPAVRHQRPSARRPWMDLLWAHRIFHGLNGWDGLVYLDGPEQGAVACPRRAVRRAERGTGRRPLTPTLSRAVPSTSPRCSTAWATAATTWRCRRSRWWSRPGTARTAAPAPPRSGRDHRPDAARAVLTNAAAVPRSAPRTPFCGGNDSPPEATAPANP